ncbi:MAG TPA: type II toxin-antitoxin system VapC family toxin [Acidobacteriota bacterium]
MRFLLDTVTFLWIISDRPELSDQARELSVDPDNEIYLSAVSVWEIAIKHSLGRLKLAESPERFIPIQRAKHGIESLPLDEESALHVSRLPRLHHDPFDRMLICQALIHGLVILSPDQLLSQYPVRVSW